ncbi:PaaI family thioesterase [Nocardioides luteus]|uniref:PaaI family thioesterase n=1 Tax=Nocardioides luteus TaxID=1844 RepID=UPI0018CA0C83|nr:PaaI family thioesterase [Nocardioides luteus]MBG6099054.1 acyl-coenzyme A thioesterase PaaI-like protein [Nocardioides luteus]
MLTTSTPDDPSRASGLDATILQVRRLLDALGGAGNAADWGAATHLLGLAADLFGRAQVAEVEQIVGRRFDLPDRGQALTPRLELWRLDSMGAVGTTTFGRFHLGSNGAAHGGSVSLLFDELMGHIIEARGTRARTAYLTTQYRSITPIDTALNVEATVDHVERRKVFISATIRRDEVLCAEAEALFVELRPGQP